MSEEIRYSETIYTPEQGELIRIDRHGIKTDMIALNEWGRRMFKGWSNCYTLDVLLVASDGLYHIVGIFDSNHEAFHIQTIEPVTINS